MFCFVFLCDLKLFFGGHFMAQILFESTLIVDVIKLQIFLRLVLYHWRGNFSIISLVILASRKCISSKCNSFSHTTQAACTTAVYGLVCLLKLLRIHGTDFFSLKLCLPLPSFSPPPTLPFSRPFSTLTPPSSHPSCSTFPPPPTLTFISLSLPEFD